MDYDIRSSGRAIKTIERLTGVPRDVWERERKRNQYRYDYTNVDEEIRQLVEKYRGTIPVLEDIELIVTHITTSKSDCYSILKEGLVDLRKAYNNEKSDLRMFLDENEIYISVEERELRHKNNVYDISYGACPRNYDSEEYACWSVGRKLYYDFTVCGFLSINPKNIYGGYIHLRPEILSDIDKLLKTNLSDKWKRTHRTYEIVFRIPVKDTVYNGWDDDDYGQVMCYLSDAYICACTRPSTIELLCKNHVEILPEQIIEYGEFEEW